MTDGSRDPWAGSTYGGFSDGGVSGARATPAAPVRPAPTRGRAGWIAAGVAAAALLGVSVGLVTRQDLGDEPGPPDPPLASASDATMPIEVAAATPAPPPSRPAQPLEVLPPDMAKAANAAARVAAPVAPRLTPAVEPRQVAEVAAAPPEVPASARVVDPPPARQAGFDCRYAETRAEHLVCGDGQLARLDRRLNRAFDDAAAAGVPRRALREDQDDWLGIREDAARRGGRAAVASVYRQRIAELEELAREASGPY